MLVSAENALGEQLVFFASWMQDKCNKHVGKTQTFAFAKTHFLNVNWHNFYVLTHNSIMFAQLKI